MFLKVVPRAGGVGLNRRRKCRWLLDVRKSLRLINFSGSSSKDIRVSLQLMTSTRILYSSSWPSKIFLTRYSWSIDLPRIANLSALTFMNYLYSDIVWILQWLVWFGLWLAWYYHQRVRYKYWPRHPKIHGKFGIERKGEYESEWLIQPKLQRLTYFARTMFETFRGIFTCHDCWRKGWMGTINKFV